MIVLWFAWCPDVLTHSQDLNYVPRCLPDVVYENESPSVVCWRLLVSVWRTWLCVSLSNSAFSFFTLKSSIREYLHHRNRQIPTINRGALFPGGLVVTYLPVHLCTVLTYWWVNTGILYAAAHSDSVGTIPSQYSVVYQPSSLQHSSAEYIVWPKVTQPVSGEVRILTWDVLCLQGPCSSTPFCCFRRGQALDTDCLALPLDQLHNCGQVTYILYP